ncbi:putative formamidopyrimidine-DNA glycosylase [Coleophoma cylindrospora]|uniref:Putative formamidopyrimidine-DNA glycosylase n=1 Tax=Coleophoma cylindrospora TaxID=1849047 RepID=A0A3D8RMB2_9HELO|nr:putative formamidopyrimidine-DNA glycosylase [Coleophoma cylindrospora]
MPEIAEVARIVHFLKKSLVGKTLEAIKAQDDANIFGKVGTSAAEFQESLTGKKVLDAGQQGKYFWLVMSSAPHPVLHFGMTGWIHIRGEPTFYYRTAEEATREWPPKYWKCIIETKESPKVEIAYTDPRRFGRIRLLHCAGEDIRKTTPLKENGPDPVIDKDVVTEDWLEQKLKSKHVPIKALLLDQANISGIGNYVGDEILYHAKLHPEQYSDTFISAQIKQLHTSILHVCQLAVDALGDSTKFPDEWIFHHRWGKGKRGAPTTLPTGEKLVFLTVGGRTSCVVPSVQKKTGPVAADVKKEDAESVDGENGYETKAKVPRKRKPAAQGTESPYFKVEGDSELNTSAKKSRKREVNTQSLAPAASIAEADAAQGIDFVKVATKPYAPSRSARKSKASERSGETPSAETSDVLRRSRLRRSSRRLG